MRKSLSVIVSCLTLLAAACSKPAAITDCEPKGNVRPVCTFQNPEDFALLPDGRTLVVSQMGKYDGSEPGNLVFLDLESKWVTAAWIGQFGANAQVTEGWGDPKCPGSPGAAFSPHGVSFGSGPDGQLTLLVVNHGGRESVEYFQVTVDPPQLAWRGCVVAPADTFLNDVALLPGGAFAVTNMYPKSHETLYSLAGLAGFSTGYVLEWQPQGGFHKVAGSDGRMPNGIELSKDGEAFYVDMYLGGEVRKISRRTGETLASAKVVHPDNISWSPDDSLLVASHDAGLSDLLACNRIDKGACPARFSIIQLDPETLAETVVFQNEGPPMGAGTAALRVGKELIIGTFKGDRILRVDLRAAGASVSDSGGKGTVSPSPAPAPNA